MYCCYTIKINVKFLDAHEIFFSTLLHQFLRRYLFLIFHPKLIINSDFFQAVCAHLVDTFLFIIQICKPPSAIVAEELRRFVLLSCESLSRILIIWILGWSRLLPLWYNCSYMYFIHVVIHLRFEFLLHNPSNESSILLYPDFSISSRSCQKIIQIPSCAPLNIGPFKVFVKVVIPQHLRCLHTVKGFRPEVLLEDIDLAIKLGVISGEYLVDSLLMRLLPIITHFFDYFYILLLLLSHLIRLRHNIESIISS